MADTFLQISIQIISSVPAATGVVLNAGAALVEGDWMLSVLALRG